MAGDAVQTATLVRCLRRRRRRWRCGDVEAQLTRIAERAPSECTGRRRDGDAAASADGGAAYAARGAHRLIARLYAATHAFAGARRRPAARTTADRAPPTALDWLLDALLRDNCFELLVAESPPPPLLPPPSLLASADRLVRHSSASASAGRPAEPRVWRWRSAPRCVVALHARCPGARRRRAPPPLATRDGARFRGQIAGGGDARAGATGCRSSASRRCVVCMLNMYLCVRVCVCVCVCVCVSVAALALRHGSPRGARQRNARRARALARTARRRRLTAAQARST